MPSPLQCESAREYRAYNANYISHSLYGILCHQCYVFFERYAEDTLLSKFSVSL